MSDSPRMRLEFDRGGHDIRVQILEQEPATFAADELSTVIRMLADARKELLPPVEISDPVVGQSLQIGIAVRWYVEPRPDGGQILMLLHPGLGWVAIEIARGEAERLSGLLMESTPSGPLPRAN
ncbi:MAG: hypothetical protein ACRYHQ_14500 [Janthinobacterium lividum]